LGAHPDFSLRFIGGFAFSVFREIHGFFDRFGFDFAAIRVAGFDLDFVCHLVWGGLAFRTHHSWAGDARENQEDEDAEQAAASDAGKLSVCFSGSSSPRE
jgi:hypothetical protein